jgi:hypothetical protein
LGVLNVNRPMEIVELVRPFIPCLVQICFRVPAHKGPWLPAAQVGFELMWVNVDACKGNWPNGTYQGTLNNVPVFIGPEKLQIGSAITFQMPHVVKNFNDEMHLRDGGCPPYVSIEEDSKPWLTVIYRTRKPAYPLIAAGIRKAGRDLYDSGQHDWSYSSSVDFPEEHGCRLDVRTLLEGAFVARAEEVGDKRFSGATLGFHGAVLRSLPALKEAMKGSAGRIDKTPLISPPNPKPDQT